MLLLKLALIYFFYWHWTATQITQIHLIPSAVTLALANILHHPPKISRPIRPCARWLIPVPPQPHEHHEFFCI